MMNKLIFLLMLSFYSNVIFCQQNRSDNNVPLAPEKYRRPVGYDPIPYRYKYSLAELKDMYSEKMMKKAEQKYDSVQQVIIKGKWKATAESIDSHPTPEWFEDLKLGMFIDWGLWSIAGWAPKLPKEAMYPDWYELNMYSDPMTRLYHEKN